MHIINTVKSLRGNICTYMELGASMKLVLFCYQLFRPNNKEEM